MAEDKRLPIESVTLVRPSLKEEEKRDVISTPAGQAFVITQQALQQGKTIGYELWAQRKMNLNHRSELKISPSEEEVHLTYKTENNTVELTLPTAKQLNVATQKLFPFFINETCKRCIHKGELYSETFTFKTSELVEVKMYQDIRSAKKALVNARKNLRKLSVGQTETKGKEVRAFAEGTIFPTVKLNENGECFVRINPDINWEMITDYWTILPSYYYSLSKKASSLLWYILIAARQSIRMDKIQTDSTGKSTYTFVCTFRALQTAIPLPSENTVDKDGKPCLIKKANEDIKKPLKDIVEEILKAHRATYRNRDIGLTLKVDEALNIREWLDTGFLEVSISGDFLKNFLDIAISREKKIESNLRKKTQREEEAKTRALAKTMEEAAKASES